MKVLDFTKVAIKYKGMWVALAGPQTTKVAGAGKTIEEALKHAYEKGCKNPILSFMSANITKVHVGCFPIDI